MPVLAVVVVRLRECWIMVLLMANLNFGGAGSVVEEVELVDFVGSLVMGVEDSETRALRKLFCNV